MTICTTSATNTIDGVVGAASRKGNYTVNTCGVLLDEMCILARIFHEVGERDCKPFDGILFWLSCPKHNVSDAEWAGRAPRLLATGHCKPLS